ncbi:unnamed protein product, partial [Ilex paraguariensis]
MDEVFSQSKRFFDLPIKEKMKLLRNKKHRGYTPVLDERLDPINQVQGDYKEGYYIGVEVPDDDSDIEKPFYGPNVWPSTDILPGWRQTMEKYHREALEVAKAIARLIALALDLGGNFFDQQEMLGKPIANLRLLHYEGLISDPTKGLYGAGAHSDFGLITLLATDDVSGLQICKHKDAKPQIWEYVAPLKGWLAQTRMVDPILPTSGIKSMLGSSIVDSSSSRQIAFFVEPNHDCLVECLPTCQSPENPP